MEMGRSVPGAGGGLNGLAAEALLLKSALLRGVRGADAWAVMGLMMHAPEGCWWILAAAWEVDEGDEGMATLMPDGRRAGGGLAWSLASGICDALSTRCSMIRHICPGLGPIHICA